MERISLINRKITLLLTVLGVLFLFHAAAIQNTVWAKTCWVSGQDSCRSNCQQQFNYACDDGSTYSEVKNCCGSGGGGSTQTAPGVPTGVDYNCTYTGNQVTIQWGAVSGASKYAVRVQRDGQALPACNGQQAASYGGVCNDNVTGTSFTMNVDPDASYGYWLHAVNNAGWSGAVSGPTKIRCAPNCSNVSGPNALLTNQTGNYSAAVESLDGDLTGQLFVNNFSAMGSYNRLPGYSGTTTYDWRPTSAGSYQMNCRAWNDSRVECRAAGVPRVNGSGVVNPPEQRQCVGPNTTKTVQVFSPASVSILSQSSNGNISFRSSWGDKRPSRSVNLAKCKDSTCRTLESSFSCPSALSISGSTKSNSGGWCRYEMTDTATTKDWTVNAYNSGLAPGTYVFAINQVVGGAGCSGNPICTMNGGSVNCGSTWISCGGSDYVTFAALAVPTNTPTPTTDPLTTCKPTQISPINGVVVNGIPTLNWNSCTGVSHYRVTVNGGGIAWTSFGQTATTYTMNGFTFNPGSTYTWKVQGCSNSSCTKTSAWTTGQTFKSPPPAVPDLTVAGTIAVKPTSVLVGQSVNIKFTVKNIGTAPGSGVYSYTSQADGNSSIASDNTCNGSTVLAPGATCISSYNFTFPTAGSKKMDIFVDPSNKVAESNENNNKFSATVTVTAPPTTPTPTTSYVCSTDNDCAYCGTNCITKNTQLMCTRIAVIGLSCICVSGRCTSVTHTATPNTPTPTVQAATATAVPPTNTSAPLPTVDDCPNFVLGNATCDAEGVINNEDYTCWRNQYLAKLKGETPSAVGTCKRVANFDSSTDGVGLLDFAIWRVNALRQSSQ